MVMAPAPSNATTTTVATRLPGDDRRGIGEADVGDAGAAGAVAMTVRC
jgi:hypothetical protein